MDVVAAIKCNPVREVTPSGIIPVQPASDALFCIGEDDESQVARLSKENHIQWCCPMCISTCLKFFAEAVLESGQFSDAVLDDGNMFFVGHFFVLEH